MSIRTPRARTMKRKDLAKNRRSARKAGRFINDFASDRFVNLDMYPAGFAISSGRLNLVLAAIERSGVAPYVERRLRGHQGKPCSYSPVLIAAGAVLSVMAGNTLEIVDVTKALGAIHPLDRMELGLVDDDGYLISYRSVDHQFNRLTRALEAGWTDPDGTWCDTQWFVDRVLDATIPDDAPALRSTSMDGLALETWARKRFRGYYEDDEVAVALEAEAEAAYDDRTGFLAPEALVEDDTRAPAPPPEPAKKSKTKAPTKRKWVSMWPMCIADRRPIPTADPDARLGKRTVTESQPTKMFAGYELHLATQVRTAHWEGDPEHITLGEDVPHYIRGMRLRRASEYRAEAGVDMLVAMKTSSPSLDEVLADRGYTQLKAENFHDPVRELGMSLVMDYKTTMLKKAPSIEIATGRRNVKNNTNPRQRVWNIAGGLFHQYMPAEYLDNPAVPWKSAAERAQIEAYYNKRSAYAYRVHSMTEGGTIRMRCPSCAGSLRPLDVAKAAATDKLEMPALDVPEGVTCCCVQTIITTTPEDRGPHWQEIPYGTTAWSASFGRRSLIENRNSMLRVGLARLTRGYFRVFGKEKISFLVGMALVALNLKMVETDRRHVEVEVIDFDEAELAEYFGETVDAGDDIGDDIEAPLARGPSPPGEDEANPTTE